MAQCREVMTADSPHWEKCARHISAQTSRMMQSIYLCDACARRLTREAFNRRPPIYHGETVAGFCGLCNLQKQVTHRMWFVCPICWNIILAYQKSFVASRAVHEYWKVSVVPALPSLRLSEQEEVRLSGFGRSGTTKREAAASLEALDFLVTDTAAKPFQPVFHIELKAGPRAIEEMKEFQLDINDSNDIIGVIVNTRLPAYIFHVQVVQQYLPPTRRSRALGLWYTDIWTLLANRRSTKHRRGEDKQAGYYSPAAFKPISAFVGELHSQAYRELAEKVVTQPLRMT